MTGPARYTKKQLSDFIASVFVASRMPEDHASVIADLMAEADLNGSDGHGIFRLPGYVRRIREGGLNLTPDIRVETEKSGMALVNGDNAQGHLVMKFCAEKAIEKT